MKNNEITRIRNSYETATTEEREAFRAALKSVREAPEHLFGRSMRYRGLAMAFLRGMPYRRVERKTRTQKLDDGTVVVHNRPDAAELTLFLARRIPGFAPLDEKRPYNTPPDPDVKAWLASEEGAIQAPAPRQKKPFGKPQAPAEEAAPSTVRAAE